MEPNNNNKMPMDAKKENDEADLKHDQEANKKDEKIISHSDIKIENHLNCNLNDNYNQEEEKFDTNNNNHQNQEEKDLDDNTDFFKEPLLYYEKREREIEKEREYFSFKIEDISDEKFQKEVEESILNTINAIGEKGKIHFKDFEEAVYNDSIPKFVMYYLKIDKIKGVTIKEPVEQYQKRDYLKAQEIMNIKSVVSYLSEKAEEFSIFAFDYSTPSKIIESTIYFYINFLDNFFLGNKYLIIRRCYYITSMISQFVDDVYGFNYSHPEVCLCLLHFFIRGSIHGFNYPYYWLFPYFTVSKVPLVASSYLFKYAEKECKYFSIISPPLYQLQFIFKAIDTYGLSHRIVELFYTAAYKIRQIKLPNFKIMIQKYNIRNYSMKYKTNNSNDEKSYENFKQQINELKEEELTFKTFKDRQKEADHLNIDENNNNNNKVSKECMPFEKFWNNYTAKYNFENGIFYEKNRSESNQKTSELQWINEFNIIKNTNLTEFDVQHSRYTHMDYITKIYRIFYYNEIDQNWEFNSSDFQSFINDKKLNFKGLKTPLILCMNTNEDTMNTFLTQNIIGNLPNIDEIDEEQIFVYALNEKSLFELLKVDGKIHSNLIKNSYEGSTVMPIFLQLHIPKKKINMPNIELIIIQIYAFLSIFCDLEIVILDKTSYIEQIEFTKKFFNIFHIINKNMKPISEFKSNSSSSSDSDEYDMEEEKWENINLEENNIIGNEEFRIKEPKLLYIINEESKNLFVDIQKKIEKSNFFKNLISNDFVYIDLNYVYSYISFYIFMTKNICDGSRYILDINKYFNNVKYSTITDVYIKLKENKSTWKEELKNLINKRYQIIESSENQNKSLFDVLTILEKELSNISPYYDFEFNDEYSLIFSQLSKEKYSKEQDKLKVELKISSDEHLKFIEKSMNKKYFWTNEQMLDIKQTHERFLNEEFFNIIQLSFPSKIYSIIYEENINVLKTQIKDDDEKIQKIFKHYNEINDIKNKTQEESLQEDINKRTNYSLSEKENLREIKVTVQISKDLKSEIEQDF